MRTLVSFYRVVSSILRFAPFFNVKGKLLFFVFQSSSKKYFEDFCGTLESLEVDVMRQVFNDRSVLFLGCDPNREEYKKFFQKFAVTAKVT